jgi:hypothetical protein
VDSEVAFISRMKMCLWEMKMDFMAFLLLNA